MFWIVFLAVGFASLAVVQAIQDDLMWAGLYSLGAAIMAWQAIRDYRRGERFGLRRKRRGSRSGESARQLREDGQVGVKLDPIKSTDAKRQ